MAAALLLAFAPSQAAAATGPGCVMADEDRAWLAEGLAHWRTAETELLLLEPQPLPLVIAIDDDCTYSLPAGNLDAMSARAHNGEIELPDGGKVPTGPISFAGFNHQPFFVMSLPGVWRDAGVTSIIGLERLLHGVLLHEMSHTRQAEMAHARVRDLAAKAGIDDGDDLNDDLIQDYFENDPAYVAAWSAERDLFFAAARAPDDAEARRLAGEAFAMMQARHARWFTGEREAFRAFDGIFLTMEGMGQWLIYRHFISDAGGYMPPALALHAVRRGGEQWSQDQGLAIIMVVDRLLPGWQGRAFRDPDWRADRLLAAALDH